MAAEFRKFKKYVQNKNRIMEEKPRGDEAKPQRDLDKIITDNKENVKNEEENGNINARVPFKPLNIEEVKKMETSKHIFKNVLVEKHHTIIVGRAGSLKSTIAASIGFEAAKHGYSVHYWGFDISNTYLAAMVMLADSKNILNKTFFIPSIDELTPKKFINAYQNINNMDKIVIIVDTLGYLTNDVLSKASNKKMMEFMRKLTKRGATILSLSHTNKNGEDFAGTAEIEQLSDAMLKIEAIEDSEKFFVEIDKLRRVRYLFDRPIHFEVKKTPVTVTDEIERAMSFLMNTKFLGDGKIDIAKEIKRKEKIEKHRFEIETVQAILRINGRMTQKDLITAMRENVGMGANKAISLLNDPDFAGRFWKIEHDKADKNKKYFILIDTTQRIIDRISERLS